MRTFRQQRACLLASTLATILITGIADAHAGQDEVRVSEGRATTPAAPARPRQGAESRSVIVRYADLNTAGVEGAKTLYARLRTAARSVCAPAPQRDLAAHRDWSMCYSDALEKAVADSGSGPVAQIHHERSGRSATAQVASAN